MREEIAGLPGGAQPYHEMLGPGGVLAKYEGIQRWLEETPASALAIKRREAELLFRRIGITFAVYTEGGDPERLIPFDIIPRVLAAGEWAYLAARPDAARARAQRLPPRRLSRARDSPRRRDARCGADPAQ